MAGGPLALAAAVLACGACLAWPVRRAPGEATTRDPAARLPVLAAAAMVASGLLSAVRPFGQGFFGPFGWPAQACALVALAAALIPAAAVTARQAPQEDR